MRPNKFRKLIFSLISIIAGAMLVFFLRSIPE